MKTLIISLLILTSFVSFSQDKIILLENSEVIYCEILCISETDFIFKIENERQSIAKSLVVNFILYDYENRVSHLCNGNYKVDSTIKPMETMNLKNNNIKTKRYLTKFDLNSNEKLMYYSGLELQKYTKHNRIGLGLTIGGGAMAIIGNNIYNNNPSKNVGMVFTYLGAATAIVGTVFILEAPKHIKNAGLILSGNGVGVKISF